MFTVKEFFKTVLKVGTYNNLTNDCTNTYKISQECGNINYGYTTNYSRNFFDVTDKATYSFLDTYKCNDQYQNENNWGRTFVTFMVQYSDFYSTEYGRTENFSKTNDSGKAKREGFLQSREGWTAVPPPGKKGDQTTGSASYKNTFRTTETYKSSNDQVSTYTIVSKTTTIKQQFNVDAVLISHKKTTTDIIDVLDLTMNGGVLKISTLLYGTKTNRSMTISCNWSNTYYQNYSSVMKETIYTTQGQATCRIDAIPLYKTIYIPEPNESYFKFPKEITTVFIETMNFDNKPITIYPVEVGVTSKVPIVGGYHSKKYLPSIGRVTKWEFIEKTASKKCIYTFGGDQLLIVQTDVLPMYVSLKSSNSNTKNETISFKFLEYKETVETFQYDKCINCSYNTRIDNYITTTEINTTTLVCKNGNSEKTKFTQETVLEKKNSYSEIDSYVNPPYCGVRIEDVTSFTRFPQILKIDEKIKSFLSILKNKITVTYGVVNITKNIKTNEIYGTLSATPIKNLESIPIIRLPIPIGIGGYYYNGYCEGVYPFGATNHFGYVNILGTYSKVVDSTTIKIQHKQKNKNLIFMSSNDEKTNFKTTFTLQNKNQGITTTEYGITTQLSYSGPIAFHTFGILTNNSTLEGYITFNTPNIQTTKIEPNKGTSMKAVKVNQLTYNNYYIDTLYNIDFFKTQIDEHLYIYFKEGNGILYDQVF